MILMIDNYDSFTYNLVQYLGELGEELQVYRNDKISVQEAEKIGPHRLVVSPGPCTPLEAGISNDLIKHFAGKIPILGVCLGHQCLAYSLDGEIVSADRLMHGKTSLIHHDGQAIYRDLPNPFEATRYHSLVVRRDNLPDCFQISAQTDQGEIMGIRHKEFAAEGVQFHPESILTAVGKQLLRNFLAVKER